jgi:ferrous iron transport protein B
MSTRKVALIGNPNTGKSSLFNLLTGLNQTVGNFAGVTVDKKVGHLRTAEGTSYELIDLPGLYSIFPKTEDEKVVFDILSNPENKDFPDAIVVVADATNLKRNLLLFAQVKSLGIPTLLLVNKNDQLIKKNLKIDFRKLQKNIGNVPVIPTNARLTSDKKEILKRIDLLLNEEKSCIKNELEEIQTNEEKRVAITNDHLKWVDSILEGVISNEHLAFNKKSSFIDKIILHPVGGYLIFSLVLFLIFQFIYKFAETPMDFIDLWFSQLAQGTSNLLPNGIFNQLVTEGIIPGLGGVVIFIPQIAILFGFIAILEETGYMSRVVFLMDKLMRPLGLSGKSVVPLMGSIACAIPGVMSARTIAGWKNRMITILVAPFMSCSARIPVYTLLIALVIPDKTYFGLFNLKGITLMSLYLLGTLAALVSAWILKKILKSKNLDFLLMEMPNYSWPNWKNVFFNMYYKTKDFVVGAGKIILTLSIIIWALATWQPTELSADKSALMQQDLLENRIDSAEYKNKLAALELENSAIGRIGKVIEPVIQPLGYDWKIGIALVTSFAAREVFVSTLATIYSVGSDEDHGPIIEKMRKETFENGEKVYSQATGISLMIFYVFAMQCMSTLAIVKKETMSWKWPILQLVFMGFVAYLSSYIGYQLWS